jgi:hypothetical protein
VKHCLQFTKQLLLVITPLLATTMLATLPSRAATFASSEGQFEFSGFSQSSSRVLTNAESNTFTLGQGGSAIANASAEAFFEKLPAQAFNFSSSVAFGENKENKGYLAEAQSQASIIGIFDVEANSDFSFDFAGNLNLLTSIDNPSLENARASGDITFALLDIANNNNILESFSLSGNLITKGDEDFIGYEKTENVTLKNLTPVSSFDERKEFVTASVEGFVKRSFADKTNLALIEIKKNKVTVKTPEPSTSLAFLLGSGVFGLVLKRKRQEKTVMDALGTSK